MPDRSGDAAVSSDHHESTIAAKAMYAMGEHEQHLWQLWNAWREREALSQVAAALRAAGRAEAAYAVELGLSRLPEGTLVEAVQANRELVEMLTSNRAALCTAHPNEAGLLAGAEVAAAPAGTRIRSPSLG